jgi:hypothetical protein
MRTFYAVTLGAWLLLALAEGLRLTSGGWCGTTPDAGTNRSATLAVRLGAFRGL